MPDPRSSPSPLPETDLPHGVRFAQPGDYTQLFALLITAHAENGRGGVDRAVVSSTIHAAIDGNRYVMGVVPGPKGVEAVIGLQPNKPWWGDDTTWYYSELLIYVRPDCRRSHHFSKLMAFARWWGDYVGAPVVLDVQPVARLEAKLKAFGRHARMVGGSFLMGRPPSIQEAKNAPQAIRLSVEDIFSTRADRLHTDDGVALPRRRKPPHVGGLAHG